jgi:2-polyprenyl-6-hydroxyphenyl methylase/3-demethylubiquinone-9 3-methyltransferase
VTIDNDVYNRLGTSWWDDHSPLVLLHGSMTTGRLEYFRGVLDRLGRLPPGNEAPTALDIGSGGGLLRLRRGRLTYRQVSERLDMGQTRNRSLFTMGFALNVG